MTPHVFISIKTQFVLLALLLVAVSSALWGWWAWKNERHLLYENLEGKGQQMVSSLASPIINALLYEEMGVIEEGGLLDNFIEEMMNNSGFPVVYAYVVDQEGKVLAHNSYSEYGKIYSDPLTRTATIEKRFISRVVPAQHSLPSTLDMAMPLHIYGKSWGALRVGVSTVQLEEELHSLARRIIGASLTFFLFGALLSWLIGQNMARPLQRLTALMSAVSSDNLSVELPPRRPDEIGVLQQSFQGMIERLQRSETAREQTMAQLVQSEKLASIGKLVAGVAHEVNNPLAAISTCIHNLQTEGQSNRNLEIISQGVERIERIVRQLTDFSRAGSLDLQHISSNSFFAESAEFTRMALRRYDIRLEIEDGCQPPLVLALDKGKLQQVLLNLLINAANASAPGAAVRLSASTAADCYLLAVHDQGCGIPEQVREQVFDIFYTTKLAGQGTGIGLAICKSIVEMHGGAIRFESRPGDTTFTVIIPVSTVRSEV